MTNAHRPTFKSSVAEGTSDIRLAIPSRNYSVRDQAGELNVKQRQIGQANKSEVDSIDFKQQLLEAEKKSKDKDICYKSIQQEKEKNIQKVQKTEENYENQNLFPEDDDDEDFMHSSSQNSSSDSSDEEDSDEELLMREFNKIKQQKEELQKQKAEEQADLEAERKAQNLLNGKGEYEGEDYSIGKKWYEDTIFKNQAKKDQKQKKSFLNDNVRSIFHKKFLNKYVLS